jgi:predicted GIY-YIG superfamily endonuclease
MLDCTNDFKKRLSDHNCRTKAHTDTYTPWKVVILLVFKIKIKHMNLKRI